MRRVNIAAAESAYRGIRPRHGITFREFAYALQAYLFEERHEATEDPASQPEFGPAIARHDMPPVADPPPPPKGVAR